MSTFSEGKDAFNRLDTHEQKMLVAVSVVVLVFLIYSLLYKPMSDTIDKLQKTNVTHHQLLTWMSQSAASLTGSSSSKSKVRNRQGRSLNVIINTSASSANISISRSQPRDNKQYQIWLDQVVFNELLRWLIALQTDYGINVSTINLGSTNNKGQVRVNLTFQDVGSL